MRAVLDFLIQPPQNTPIVLSGRRTSQPRHDGRPISWWTRRFSRPNADPLLTGRDSTTEEVAMALCTRYGLDQKATGEMEDDPRVKKMLAEMPPSDVPAGAAGETLLLLSKVDDCYVLVSLVNLRQIRMRISDPLLARVVKAVEDLYGSVEEHRKGRKGRSSRAERFLVLKGNIEIREGNSSECALKGVVVNHPTQGSQNRRQNGMELWLSAICFLLLFILLLWSPNIAEFLNDIWRLPGDVGDGERWRDFVAKLASAAAATGIFTVVQHLLKGMHLKKFFPIKWEPDV